MTQNQILAMIVLLISSMWVIFLTSLLGIIMLRNLQLLKKKSNESLQWPATLGTITKSQVVECIEDYLLEIEYTYQVNQQTYTGRRIDFGTVTRSYSKPDLEQIRRRFPYGQTVTVFYNPQNPRDSALSRSAPSGCSTISAWIVLLVGLAFGLFLAYGLWVDTVLK